MLMLRLVWGHRAQSRLDAAVAAIAAKGEPIHFDDMRRPPVPDEQNKAYFLRQALAQWPTVPGQGVVVTETLWYREPEIPSPQTNSPNPWITSPQVPPQRRPDPITDNAAYLVQVEPMLDLLEQAAAAPQTDWGVQLQSPATNMLLPMLGDHRKLARLADDAARRALDVGDIATALRATRLTDSAADASIGHPPSIVGNLVAISIRALVDGTLEERLPTIAPPALASGEARQEAQRLLASLLDDNRLQHYYKQGMVGERWMTLDTATAVAAGPVPISALYMGGPMTAFPQSCRWLVKPVFTHDIRWILDYETALVEVVQQPRTYPQAQAFLSQRTANLESRLDSGRRMVHPLSVLLLPALDAVVRTYYQKLAVCHMTAAALAIRLYEGDHGHRPDTLNALVPTYLPAVPVDPFDPDGGLIRYQPTGAKVYATDHATPGLLKDRTGPPILYSVGANGVDDGGVIAVNAQDQIDDTQRYRDEYPVDLWFLLDAHVPSPRQAHDPQVQHDQWRTEPEDGQ